MHLFKKIYSLLLIILLTNCEAKAAILVPNLIVDINQLPSKNYDIGPFIISWNAQLLQFDITNQSDLSKSIWSSVQEKGFIHGAQAIDMVEDSRGSFVFEEEIIEILSNQSIENIDLINNQLVIKGKVYNNAVQTDYTLIFKSNGDNQLNFDVNFENNTFNRVYFTYSAEEEEAFYGFGEQCSFFNNKGKKIPIWVNEQGVGRGDITDPIINAVLGLSGGNETSNYISVPHYISTSNRSLYLENTNYSVFDLTESDKVQIDTWSSHLVGNIISGNSPKELITEYTTYSGRMRKLPSWVGEGAIIGLQGGTEKLYDEWAALEEKGTPIAAFWVQDWIGQRTTIVGKQLWWNWELDNDRYPNWDELVDTLGKKNIRLLGYINPFIANIYGQKTNIRRNIFLEARTNGFLVKKENGDPYLIKQTSFDAGIIDLTNPACRVWIKEIIKDELIARGLKGWMADFAEALPYDAVLFSGESPKDYHNKYTEVWMQINREAIEESGYGDEMVFFARSGFTQSPKYSTLFWQGDQLVDWGQNDGIKSAMTGLMSAGISGFSLNHSDIGGYTTVTYPIVKNYVRSKELLKRWIEMSAFTAVFRTHEGLNPDKNYQIFDSDETLEHFAKYAKIYKAWGFYREQLIDEANSTGIPVIRHPYLEFQNDLKTQDIVFEQFMIGSEFMVAPVLEKNKVQTNIYLPNGRWINLWDGTILSSNGQSFTITNLVDKPAVFYKENSTNGIQFRNNLIDEGLAE